MHATQTFKEELCAYYAMSNKSNTITAFSLNNILLKYSTIMQYIHCQWIHDLTVS